ncbi:MAG: alkaline phosphatase [Spirochaetales bacterium]|nr:alkaline phosphatase [Spirochaetales bacterium]
MKKKACPRLILTVVSIFVLFITSCRTSLPDYSNAALKSRNTILIIGDGMGPEQVKAASLYLDGEEGQLSFETDFPYRTTMTTHSLLVPITDSAASATAMATGQKVRNGQLSVSAFSGRYLKTILEIAADEGKMTGLVTTAHVAHATPAAFAVHVYNRNHYDEIARQYLANPRVDLLFGGANDNLPAQDAAEAGYTVLTDTAALSALAYGEGEKYLGSFGDGHLPYEYDYDYEGTDDLPKLSEMALKALEILENAPGGFFLMIEAGRIDHAGHANDLARNIYETLELSNTVEQVLTWAAGREDTVIIVTADHETGGLRVRENNGAGSLPTVRWRTSGHTDADVPVYVWGDRAGEISARIEDNTDIFKVLVQTE